MKIATLPAMALMLILPVGAAIAGDPDAAKKSERIAQMLRAMEKPIEFYGKVVDLDGAAVADARVILQVRDFHGSRAIESTTDVNGRFEVKGEKGNLLYLKEVVKQGYDYGKKATLAFVYGVDLEKLRFKPDRNAPVTVKVRKKEPPTLVIPAAFTVTFDKECNGYQFDLVAKDFWRSDGGGKRNWDRHVDIQFTRMLSDDKSRTFSWEAPDDDSGLILSDALLYVAPAEGYERSRFISLPRSGKVTKHLYLKGRGGNFYTRIDIAFYSSAAGSVRVDLSSWTSPNGERNLEYDSKVYETYLQGKMEARKRGDSNIRKYFKRLSE